MATFLLVINVIVAVLLIVLVLLNQGRGADAGASFGGASQTLFGSRGSASTLSRTIAILATVFFLVNLGMAHLSAKRANVHQTIESSK